jgi:hypothetical protein
LASTGGVSRKAVHYSSSMTHFPGDEPRFAHIPDPSTEPVFEVVGPTTASEYLAEVVTLAKTVGAPSITLASLQPSVKPPGKADWAPGIGSYSWGINGQVINDTSGHPSGIRIWVRTWFSDRITNPSALPYDWQQFAAGHDDAILTFTPSGTEDVHLRTQEPGSMKTAWDCDSFLFDAPTQQLLFHAPGLGAPLGILIATFHPTGAFGWL